MKMTKSDTQLRVLRNYWISLQTLNGWIPGIVERLIGRFKKSSGYSANTQHGCSDNTQHANATGKMFQTNPSTVNMVDAGNNDGNESDDDLLTITDGNLPYTINQNGFRSFTDAVTTTNNIADASTIYWDTEASRDICSNKDFGSIKLSTEDNQEVTIKNVAYVPDITRNLFHPASEN
ncbi:uncharacterized protein J8A68_005490 [[Candida] subhashii]|uniref:Retrovirus-related Pol polyprotein from transposon TNT 1-94-like beta-barrel domain-containing protein n=1 Tax=[Candida] subhashii TaxID=561895 RepID=A0A8J5QLZ7_9ASCO|nr:uncharacterized protein J8A68_005490 [[Candida] subhashii]KAG7660970.1 hypothetical protein J8A68_005490 [[Candida] subhashii]